MNPPVLRVSGLSLRRAGTTILRNINWTVRSGENWVILGANGSGKTCLLKALAGYMPPSEGEISVLGEIYGEADWRELRKKIGVVSAAISQLVHDEDNALEIVLGGLHGMVGTWGRSTAAERRAAARLLTVMKIGRLAAREWRVLSQGERQRVLIARALMARPKILILDEPCAGLDPAARERFLHDLGMLLRRKSRPAVILVTHHIEEILPAFQYVLALKRGRVERKDRKARVLTAESLGQVFDAAVRVRASAGRYGLAITGGAGSPGKRRTPR